MKDSITDKLEVITRYEKLTGKKLNSERLNMLCDLEYSKINVKGLLDATDGDFMHDMGGLYNYFNRSTLKWEDCFVPRVGLIIE